MVSFLGLYRGDSLETAQLVAVSADAELVGQVATALLERGERPTDPALGALQKGRRRALRHVAEESQRRRRPKAVEEG
jgi:hypothetical protein